MDLIIVESPTKARTLSRYLNGEYKVEATMGHIRDLPKAELGVDVAHDFTPSYVIPQDKRKRVNELVDLAEKADSVILATDPDREGEAIAWHVAMILSKKSKNSLGNTRDKKKQKTEKDYRRIAFHEITESAIKEAIKNPRKIDMQLVDAQQARRILDRLVGYKLSPLLWQKLSRRWLSAGRVQSVAVRLIVEREREISQFSKKEYWTIAGTFRNGETEIIASLTSKNGVKYEISTSFVLFDGKYTTSATTITSESDAQAILSDLAKPFTISAVDKKEIKRSPAPPFTTSTMQQEAGRKLYFSAKKTMQVAQKLYEEGLISYHRTDSVNLSDKFIEEARNYIGSTFGEVYIPEKAKHYQTKSKVAQEAHEAIRPTNVGIASLKDHNGNVELNKDHEHLYELIWKRALASQAKDAIFDSTTLVIESANGYVFETQGSIIKFDGFLKITGREVDEKVIPNLSVGENLELLSGTPEQHFTNPPPRYTEATLVKTLEEKDIGRPSTYAPIISTIIERNYVIKEDKKMIPTELGFTVTDFLVKFFPEILNLPFTASMEGKLDEVANGNTNWVPVISEFYKSFNETLENAYQTADKVKMKEEDTGELCPKCGSPLLIRMGKFGKFIACSAFPKCDYKHQYADKIDMKCPKCGGDIVVKKSHRGKTFYGCSNYPTCTFAAWKKEDIK
jgi:DNA topoisomerase I